MTATGILAVVTPVEPRLAALSAASNFGAGFVDSLVTDALPFVTFARSVFLDGWSFSAAVTFLAVTLAGCTLGVDDELPADVTFPVGALRLDSP